MPKVIHDELELRDDLTGSRKYQLRHKRRGLCCQCPGKAVMGNYCLTHLILRRERQRRREGSRRRNWRAKSYSLNKE